MGKSIDLSGVDPRAQFGRKFTEEEAATEAANYKEWMREGRHMEDLEGIFGRHGLQPFILRSENYGILVDFDSGIDLAIECLDEIRAAFPGKSVRVCGFADETGFRIKIR